MITQHHNCTICEPRYLDYYTDYSLSPELGNSSNDLITDPFKFNRRPKVVAGEDQVVQIDDSVNLDGSKILILMRIRFHSHGKFLKNLLMIIHH